MPKKSKKSRTKRGLPHAEYMVIWRAIQSGKIESWQQAVEMGLCRPRGKTGRPSVLAKMVAKRSKATAAV